MPAVLVTLVLLAWASLAFADTQTASGGGIEAELSFESEESTVDDGLGLAVTRAGQRLDVAIPRLSGCRRYPCSPVAWSDRDAIHVRDLDADGEPEVLLDLYSGGAHCCVIAYVFAWNGVGYAPIAQNFADVGYRIGPASATGNVQLLSADVRFAYRWSSFAGSVFPVQVYEYDGRRLVDVTAGNLDRVRADAARDWSLYLRARREGGEDVRGPIAAWAANRYRLGQRTSTLRQLRRLARRGRLKGFFPPRNQRKFVTQLDRQLLRWGYRPAG